MDVLQARTFLAVLETGSFLAAAEKVNVAQSTVSARIKALEDQLGQPLFKRGKSGASATQTGQDFARHAAAIVRLWDQARLSLALPEGQKALLRIGGQPSLWDGFLLAWLPWMRENAPEIAVRAQMMVSSQHLMQNLLDGLFDMVVLYRPSARPGIVLKQIFEEQLIMVTSEPAETMDDQRYAYVDWGPEFQADHALNFPQLSTPNLTLNVGSLGISFLLGSQASGYFPRRIAAPYLARGELRHVANTPVFTYPVYAAFTEDTDPGLLATIFAGFSTVAAQKP